MKYVKSTWLIYTYGAIIDSCSVYHSDPGLTFETTVHLLLDPIATLGFISLDIDVVNEGSNILQRIYVGKQLVDIVCDLFFIWVL